MIHTHACRVYYEDTDLAGIVYYANYLKFIERARTEAVRDMGIDQTRLRDDDGIVFAVRRIEADYLAPARFDDLLTIETRFDPPGGASLALWQDVWRGEDLLFRARVVLVCLAPGPPARAMRLPQALRDAIAAQ